MSQDLERARLAALHEYELLDEPADDELDAVVRLAASVAGVPRATLNLIDANRLCQLTTTGFQGTDMPRDQSLCNVHFLAGETMQIPDASRHPSYAENPLVDGRLGQVRFYASTSLTTPSGSVLGTLCVFDDTAKTLTEVQMARLTDLGEVVVGLFERRRQSRLAVKLVTQSERDRKFIDTLLETVDVGIAAADETGQMTVLNRAARRWGGVDEHVDTPPAQLNGDYRLLQPDGITPLAEKDIPLLRLLREDTLDAAELIIETAWGEHLNIIANGRSMYSDLGDRIGAVVAFSDVTSERISRRRLEKAHADVARREDQLKKVVTELERSNEELENFAAAVSHDLVRPLAVVHGYLDLLQTERGGQFDDQATKWVGVARGAIERMQQLVQALLNYGRAGHAPYQPADVDLATAVDQVTTDLRNLIETASAEVTVRGRLPMITADETLLRQLLQNLIDNAIKYRHPDRAPRVQISCSTEPDHWHLTVEDNGLGVPAEDRERLFEMFAQVDPQSRKGHGIGLSTCLRIVERHHGTIELSDTPGGGTVVNVNLPR